MLRFSSWFVIGIGCVCTALIIGLPLQARAAQAQKDSQAESWTDSTGQYTIEGTFVSLEEGVVTIRQTNGKNLEIPLDKLSADDQKAAKKAAANPFQPAAGDSPFQPAMPEKSSTAKPAAPAVTVKAREVQVDWNAATAVNPQPKKPTWKGAIPPEKLTAGAAKLDARTIRLPKRRDFFEKARAVVFSPSGEKAMVGYTLKKPGHSTVSTRMILADTKTGKILGTDTIDGEFYPLGIEDDGRRVLMRSSKFGSGGNGRLEVWSLGKTGIQRGLYWNAHEKEDGKNHDVHWGTIVSEGRGLTLSSAGRLTLWDLETGKPIWFLDTPGDYDPAVSPNGKYLAYVAKDAIGLLEIASGTVLALLPVTESRLGALAFSPDGTYLAGSTHQVLSVWDVKTGEKYREVYVSGLAGLGNMFWVGPEYVLLSDRWLVHVPSRITVWQYSRGAFARPAGGIAWFYVSQVRGSEALVGADLPGRKAEAALAAAKADPNFFLLKPGSKVAVDASGIPTGDRDRVKKMIVSNLEKTGFQVVTRAPVTAKIAMKRGKTREIRYRHFGQFGGSKHTVQEYLRTIAFVTNGKKAWSTKSLHVPAPFMIHRKEGETIEDVLRKADNPDYEYFANVKLPKFIPRKSGGQTALGVSTITMQGIR